MTQPMTELFLKSKKLRRRRWQLLVKKNASNQLRVGCWAVVDVCIDGI
jgi:hypothetical protein